MMRWAEENIGNVTSRYGKGTAYLEADSYKFQMSLGDNDSNTISNYNKYHKRYTNN